MPRRSALSRRLAKDQRGTGGPGRPKSFRPALESLEDRTLLDGAFMDLAVEVNRQVDALQKGLAAVVATTAQLPVLNSQMDSIAGDAQKALMKFWGELRPVLESRDSTIAASVLEQQLYDLLGPPGALKVLVDVNDNKDYRDEVKVDRDPVRGLVITLNVGKETKASKVFPFGLGLPGVPFQVDSGALDVKVGFVYKQLTFGISPANAPFFDANTVTDELQATVSATLDSKTVLGGSLGFLAVTATPAGPTGLTARLLMDVQIDSAGKIAPKNPRLNGSADVDVKITANFGTAQLSDSTAQYPRISTRFVMHWGLDGSDPRSPREQLGQEPSIEFRDVTVNAGTFLSNMLGPVVRTIRDFMRPMDPILKIITAEIPVLSDMSKAVDLGPITLERLAKVLGESGKLPPDYQLLLDLSLASIAAHKLLIQIDSNKSTLEFNVGSFSLNDNNIRSKLAGNLSAENLNDLIPRAAGELQKTINERLRLSMPPELKPAFDVIDKRLRSAQNKAGFSFPFFDDPLVGVFKFILGQNVDFVNYTAQFHFDAYKTELIPIPLPLIPDFVELRLNGQIDVDAYLKVGYDTYGLRNYLRRLQLENKSFPLELANGLYFDASKPLLKMNGSISAGAAFVLPVPFLPVPTLVPGVIVPVKPNVSINGRLSAEDVQVRFGETVEKLRLLEKLPKPLFNTQGLIKAAFTVVVEAGVPGVEAVELYERVLEEVVLFDLFFGPHANPVNPFLPPGGQQDESNLIVLNLNRRMPEFPALLGPPGNDGAPDTIDLALRDGYVHFLVNGRVALKPEKLSKITEIHVIGSEDDDILTLDGRITKPMEFRGGGAQSANRLTVDDRGSSSPNSWSRYSISGEAKGKSQVRRETVSLETLTLTGLLDVKFENTAFVTLFANANAQLTGVTVNRLFNQELNLVLGQTQNNVIVDTTNGGFADTVNITHLVGPFLPPPTTSLLVRDRNTAADGSLYGRGTYVLADNKLTRSKRLPPITDPGGPIPIISVSGTTTINYSDIQDLTVKGGDLGNTFDLQDTVRNVRYRLTGGTGQDSFVVGKVHHNLHNPPDGTGIERQLGFANANLTIDGDGGLGDTLVLDDTASDLLKYNDGKDLLEYLPHNSYVIGSSFVNLFTSVETEQNPVTAQVSLTYLNIEDLTLKAGGINEIFVFDTMTAPSGIFDVARTTIIGGANADSVGVRGTTGSLYLDLGGGANSAWIGAVGALGSLDLIQGEIVLQGRATGALTDVRITDGGNSAPSSYYMDAGGFFRQGTATVLYSDAALRSLNIQGGTGGNFFQIGGSPIPAPVVGTAVSINTGSGVDSATVRRTDGPMQLDFGAGVQHTLNVGDNVYSLDAIQGDFSVAGAGRIDATLSDRQATDWRQVSIDSNFFNGQTLERYQFEQGQYTSINRFLFSFSGQLGLNYLTGQAGETVLVNSVGPNATVSAQGSPGALDVFAVGYAGNTNQILGLVAFIGQAADNDYAYYYDYLNPNPQQYGVDQEPFFGLTVVQRVGISPVLFGNLGQIILYAPPVGGNTIDIRGVTSPTFLNMAVGNGDIVTIGSSAPNLGGTLAYIHGPISVAAYANADGSLADVSLTLDNSGNPDTGSRNITLSRRTGPYDYGNHITGFAPAEVFFRLSPESTVNLLGGAADDYFTVATDLQSQITIDGGAGSNRLQSEAGVPATFTFTSQNAGTLYDNVSFTSIQSFYGTDADDNFIFHKGAGIDGGIDGFGGANTLDYSAFTSAAAGPISLYKAEGNANDSAGGNHGTLNGDVTFVPGRNGQAFDFDGLVIVEDGDIGILDYVDLGNDASLNLPGSMSVSLWVRFDTIDHWKYLFADFAEDGWTSQGALGALGVGSNFYWYQAYTDGTHDYADATTPIELNQWYHLAAVRDDSAKTVRLFINGIEEATFSYAGKTVVSLQGNKILGGAGLNFPADFMDGQLDEVSIYNRALSNSEVRSLYGIASGQVSWYRAEGNALDSIGGNHGSVVTGITYVPGRFGQAFEFDDADDHLRVNNAPNLEPTTVSVEAWVNASYPGINSYIVAKGASGNTAASYGLYTGANTGLSFYVFDGTTYVQSPDAGTGVWNGDWHHVVGSYYGTTVRLYVDGAEVGEGNPTDLQIAYNLPDSNDLFIGSYYSGYDFVGKIDEVSIFNRALSGSEVLARFNGDNGGTASSGAGVYANLQTNAATGATGGVFNIDNVIGSAGNDILVGSGGNVLSGGRGRDILLAGAIASDLYGGDGDDLLIGGTTIYDQDRQSLDALMAVWSPDERYETRVATLVNDLLAAGAVTPNGGPDTLDGQSGRDFFFASLLDWNDGFDNETFIWL